MKFPRKSLATTSRSQLTHCCNLTAWYYWLSYTCSSANSSQNIFSTHLCPVYPPDLIVAGAVASVGHHEGRCQECQTVQQTISDTSTAQQMNEEFSAVQRNQTLLLSSQNAELHCINWLIWDALRHWSFLAKLLFLTATLMNKTQDNQRQWWAWEETHARQEIKQFLWWNYFSFLSTSPDVKYGETIIIRFGGKWRRTGAAGINNKYP